MNPSAAEVAIEAYEIAEINLLLSFMGITPEQVYSQIGPEFNSIGWIFGHCAVHLHWVTELSYQNKRTYSEEVCNYFRGGATKEEILGSNPPISFKDLVDDYLRISDSSTEFLKGVGVSLIFDPFAGAPVESLLQMMYRLSLHYMGHMGQIVMIRRALGNPGRSFVYGVSKQSREALFTTWHEWWKNAKDDFNI